MESAVVKNEGFQRDGRYFDENMNRKGMSNLLRMNFFTVGDA